MDFEYLTVLKAKKSDKNIFWITKKKMELEPKFWPQLSNFNALFLKKSAVVFFQDWIEMRDMLKFLSQHGSNTVIKKYISTYN